MTLTKPLFKTLSRLFLLGGLLSFAVGLNYLNAWTAPSQAPTGGNVAAPLNVGGTLQGKSGGLTLGSTLDIGSSLTVGGVPGDGPYLVDMGAATPGAFKGIRFPDDTVQTKSAITLVTRDHNLLATNSVPLPAGDYLLLLKVSAVPPAPNADYTYRVRLNMGATALPIEVGFASPGDSDGVGTKLVSASNFGIVTVPVGGATLSYVVSENVSSPGAANPIQSVVLTALKI